MRCRHGREGTCPYCLCHISPHDFYEMMRWRAELRRKGKCSHLHAVRRVVAVDVVGRGHR